MKVQHAEQHVLGSGGLKETQAFKIRTSPHAFQILSSGLYSDKVTAVLREIGCNAADAHTAAGIRGTPFVVKLPNRIDPQFYIRDHGPGLDHEDVMNLYVSYFSSTKQDSNDFTGAFGLGSKSPFSYTDSFTVTAVQSGVKRVYHAHINNKGTPDISLMGDGPADADWQSGIEVGFPVKQSDFADFEAKAKQTFQFFDPVPSILGGPEVEPVKYGAKFAGYSFAKGQNFDGTLATMGNVAYPVDITQLGGCNPVLDAVVDDMYNRKFPGLVLHFDIGELQVAASREKLQYDPATRKVLADRLGSVVVNVVKELKDAHDKATTWQALCEFMVMRDSIKRGIPMSSKVLKLAGLHTEEFAKVLGSWNYPLPIASLPDRSKILFRTLSLATSVNGVTSVRTNVPSSATGRESIDYNKDLCIAGGTCGREYARAKLALLEGKLTGNVLLVSKAPEAPDGSGVDEAVLKLRNVFRGVPAHDLENFPAPPSPPKSKSKKKGPPDMLVKVDGLPLPMSKVHPDRKVWVQATRKRGRDIWWVTDQKTLDEYDQKSVSEAMSSIGKLAHGLVLPSPVLIPRRSANSWKMTDRQDWSHIRDYVKSTLSSSQVKGKLIKAAAKENTSLQLNSWIGPNNTGIVENLVYARHKFPSVFKSAEPVLRSKGLLDIVEKIYANSLKGAPKTGPAVHDEVIKAYANLARNLDIDVKPPALDAANSAIGVHPGAAKVPWSVFEGVAQHAPRAFDKFVESIL